MTRETPPTTDAAVLDAARSGDRAAIEELLAREQARIYAFGLKMCGNPEDARDVLQETLLAIARGVGGFRGDASLSTWVFQIARSFCLKKRRRRKGAPAAFEDIDHAPHADESLDPEERASRNETKAVVDAALARLPSASREVLVLRDIEGLTATEVAETLGISVDAVKSRLHRARGALEMSLRRGEPTRGCPDIAAMYSKQLEGELTASVCADMEAHLSTCSGCRGRCATLKSSLALCRSLPVVPPSIRASVLTALRQVLAEG